ncbi:hypothetical protein [Demequina aestuarii]|uniref:hypothetical protein n=1 Tax=Demequina aestuarii TaxID=327095 RepID=UPI0007852B71|nr:hypothetical protein [Demequina aestuarii]
MDWFLTLVIAVALASGFGVVIDGLRNHAEKRRKAAAKAEEPGTYPEETRSAESRIQRLKNTAAEYETAVGAVHARWENGLAYHNDTHAARGLVEARDAAELRLQHEVQIPPAPWASRPLPNFFLGVTASVVAAVIAALVLPTN